MSRTVNFKEQINKFFDNLIWLFLTNKCYYCDKTIEKEELFCEDCHKHLPIIAGQKCEFCGAEKERCNCKKHHMKYDGITAPFYYEEGIQEGLKLFKFSGKAHMAKKVAIDMARVVHEDFAGIKFDFICFVPFSPMQKLKRRYNQSELLAINLSKNLEVPLNPVLIKLFDSDTQHEMSSYRRNGNVYGIYDVKNSDEIKGKTILLVDDIRTTGETLNNCAVILKIRGAEKVYCVTAAITAQKINNKK